MKTRYEIELSRELLLNKLDDMVNQFYKILPLYENKSPTLHSYMESFMRELLGNKNLINDLKNDGLYLTLLGTLQFLIDNDCEVRVVKSDVFKAISIIKKLQKKYGNSEE